MFSLDHDPVGASHLIVAGGELDLAATNELSAILAMAAAGPQGAVVLDLALVDFIDSSALSIILRSAMQLETAGKRLFVVAPDGPVRRLLEITGTASRFSLSLVRDEALAKAAALRDAHAAGASGA
jgi:anti-sigma B factor antagonist